MTNYHRLIPFPLVLLVVCLLLQVVPLSLSAETQKFPAVDKENEGKYIFVNQVGYLPAMPKWVVSSEPAAAFVVVEEESFREIYRGSLEETMDPTSRRKIWRGEFTGLQTPGVYRIYIDGVGYSYPFSLDERIYDHPLTLGLRFLYLQRCGIHLEDEESGFAHPPCHVQDAFIARADEFYQEGEKISSTGGWHDAGDYGKYVPTTTVTVAHLLTAFALWPDKFYDGQLRIPESGNGLPDLLDEARIGVEWLLTMQRPDGAVYHKLAGLRWPSIGLQPDFDRQPRYIFGISTAGTGKFAAVMAIAARVFRDYDPELAAKAEKAALKAWAFLAANDFIWDHTGFDDEGSGPYGSTTDRPDRLWAALELAVLTGNDEFLSAVIDCERLIAGKGRLQVTAPGWTDASLFGLFHYARSGNSPELRKIFADHLINLADSYLAKAEKSGYHYTLNFNEFYWASNKEGLARGMTMIFAGLLQEKPAYREAALAQLNFVLGLNPLSKCFVSGLGSNPVRSPHHRLSAYFRRPVPGMMVGGPNNKSESNIEPRDEGPFSYADYQASYSSNEPAIDYSAAFIFMTAAFAGPKEGRPH